MPQTTLLGTPPPPLTIKSEIPTLGSPVPIAQLKEEDNLIRRDYRRKKPNILPETLIRTGPRDILAGEQEPKRSRVIRGRGLGKAVNLKYRTSHERSEWGLSRKNRRAFLGNPKRRKDEDKFLG